MKKWLYAFVVVLIFGIVFLLFHQSIDANFDVVTIRRDDFIQFYSIDGVVDSKSVLLDFQGTIIKVLKRENEAIKKNEEILNYRDYSNVIRTLKSSIDGHIYTIENNLVIVKDQDYFIECFLDYDKIANLEEQETVTYQIGEKIFTGRIKTIFDSANAEGTFEIDIQPDCNNLLLNQKLIVKLPIRVLSGLVVEKSAIYKNEDGWFVIDKEFMNDLQHIKDYRHNVKVILENESLALIEGVGLENLEVCIISEAMKELVLYD